MINRGINIGRFPSLAPNIINSLMSPTCVALGMIKHYPTILIIASLILLVVSFIWVFGSAFASGGVESDITYGIYSINTSNIKTIAPHDNYIISNGVGYLWINSPANWGACSSLTFPTVMLKMLNRLIVFLAVAIIILAGIEQMPALGSYVASSRY